MMIHFQNSHKTERMCTTKPKRRLLYRRYKISCRSSDVQQRVESCVYEKLLFAAREHLRTSTLTSHHVRQICLHCQATKQNAHDQPLPPLGPLYGSHNITMNQSEAVINMQLCQGRYKCCLNSLIWHCLLLANSSSSSIRATSILLHSLFLQNIYFYVK